MRYTIWLCVVGWYRVLMFCAWLWCFDVEVCSGVGLCMDTILYGCGYGM